MSGAFLLVRRAAFLEAGGFDEGFFIYFEDIDLCERILAKGWKVIFLPAAVSMHYGGAVTSARPLRSRVEYRKSQLRFYRQARLDGLAVSAQSVSSTLARPAGRPSAARRRRGGMTRVRVLEMIDKPFLGGGQVTVLTLARGLDREKFEVLVASEDGGPLVDELRKIGIRHIPVKLGKLSGPSAAARDSRRSSGITPSTSSIPTEASPGFTGAWRPGKPGPRPSSIRSTASITSITGIPPAKWAFILLERWLSRSTDAVVFVSVADMERAARLRLARPPKARLIRNGVPPVQRRSDFAIPRQSGPSSGPSGGRSSSRCPGSTGRRA